MTGKLSIIFISVFICIFAATSTFAAGFGLIEPSARANGLGGAIVAQGGDPSVLFVNPAEMTRLPGLQIETGVVILQPQLKITTYGDAPFFDTGLHKPTQTCVVNNTFAVPSLYITYQTTDKLWLGLGTFARFGLGTEFPQTWPGRYNSYYAKVTSFEINPNAAYKLTDRLSLSAGFSAMYFDVKLQKKIPGFLFNIEDDIDQTFSGDSVDYGWNIGAHYQATDWMGIGISYRSQVRQSVGGTAEFKPAAQIGSLELPSSVNGSGTITLPDQLYFGLALKPLDRLTWEIGGVLTGWNSFEQLKIEFEQPVAGQQTITSEKKWKDSWRFQTGLEYKATDLLDLRVSYVYDPSPVPDSTIDFIMPDSDRNIFGIGLGFHGKNWTLDLSYNYLIFNNRNINGRNFSKIKTYNNPADPNLKDYLPDAKLENGNCHLYGLSFGYKF